ncbi:MAG: hypothetical protein K6D97_05575 [Clostridia bacterium]|nr:hypothetical protein [Clostridia bacterium]
MKIISRKKMKPENWNITMECKGNAYESNRVPCHSTLKVEAEDVVTIHYKSRGNLHYIGYAFFCPICHCLTSIPKEILLHKICLDAPEVATKDDPIYQSLSEEEKQLSEYL